MKENEFDAGFWLLDDQIIDSQGRRCGRVDDVEFKGRAGGKTELSAILVGPGAFVGRLPGWMRRIASRVLSDRTVEVPWREVKDIDSAVHLKRPAGDIGLGLGDDEVGVFVKKLPGAT
jgi:sporulation protein YlmC with PRC-barrel domain